MDVVTSWTEEQALDYQRWLESNPFASDQAYWTIIGERSRSSFCFDLWVEASDGMVWPDQEIVRVTDASDNDLPLPV